MTPTTDQLWDALRDVACVTGRKAHRILLIHRSDVERALTLLAAQTETQPTPQARESP